MGAKLTKLRVEGRQLWGREATRSLWDVWYGSWHPQHQRLCPSVQPGRAVTPTPRPASWLDLHPCRSPRHQLPCGRTVRPGQRRLAAWVRPLAVPLTGQSFRFSELVSLPASNCQGGVEHGRAQFRCSCFSRVRPAPEAEAAPSVEVIWPPTRKHLASLSLTYPLAHSLAQSLGQCPRSFPSLRGTVRAVAAEPRRAGSGLGKLAAKMERQI